MFALTVSKTKQKNIKEAIADDVRIKAMQEELHQFDRLVVWELVDKPFSKTVIGLKWASNLENLLQPDARLRKLYGYLCIALEARCEWTLGCGAVEECGCGGCGAGDDITQLTPPHHHNPHPTTTAPATTT
ncbi:hypothetical protein Tco_0989333 [Tanacetum coccineum]|uniref:Reverse transcriptase n=1 Tax=Tanacetum coccineum TaxID=301880 RepID=A0ABQ5ETU9_9ASTR